MKIEDYKHLKFERREHGVLVVLLDNPPANATTQGMHSELQFVFETINRDPETKVVVLTGAGTRMFCAGGDVKAMEAHVGDPMASVFGLCEATRIIYAMLRLEKPIIARINGHAIGLGSSLALFCDLTYAIETAKIGDPHVNFGYTASDGGALMWPQLIGYARAREALLIGDPLTGKRAAEIGLINKSVATLEELDAAAYGMAERLATGATMAISLTKVAINMVLRRQFESLTEGHIGLELMSSMTEDHEEAVKAFFEKRKPVFKGR